MSQPPQPPPNAPVPPPSEEALRSQSRWRWILRVGIFSMVIVLFGFLLLPRIPRSRKQVDLIEAVSNAKQIGLVLFEFDSEYGKYPDLTTIAAVKSKTGSMLPVGNKTSNDFFRQLIASQFTGSEKMFYAKIRGAKKPDEVIDGSEALAKSECGFSYIAGMSSKGNSSRPIVVTPLIPGTDRFDPKPFKGKAIILRMDCSVTTMTINKQGYIVDKGMNLLDPAHPIWGGEKFTIAYPDL